MTRTLEAGVADRRSAGVTAIASGTARTGGGTAARPAAQAATATDWPASAASELPQTNPEAIPAATPRTVSICDTQPVTAEGVRTLLGSNPGLRFLEARESLRQALDHVREQAPDVLLLDKAFGIQAILDWLGDLRALEISGTPVRTNAVIWGVSVTEAEALRFLQAGARGILRKTATISVVLACLRTVSTGRSWMEDCVFRDAARSDRYPRSELTSREQQVLELVEQGFKNKEIAQELGIRPGTVKIHLKHIFEKTGVRGRYGLALSGLKDRGMVSVPA
jgi:DNA-binding NarL/FixJ family response regulator